MTRRTKTRAPWQAYLAVDDYLGDAVHVVALATAFECGLVDALLDGPRSTRELAQACGKDPGRMSLLVELLVGARALAKHADTLSLQPAFRQCLSFRDLLEAKARYARVVLSDLGERFTDLVFDHPAYAAASHAYSLFRYHADQGAGPDDVARAERWVALTTVASRYEAAALMHHFDFGGCRRLLDVGGNSGELVRRLCERHPSLRADVFDLPVICEVGRRHLEGSAEAGRIGFVAGDARTGDLPEGYDACVFKSMLHDWPDEQARRFLAKALGALVPGGRVLVFERARFNASRLKSPMRAVLSLPFWPTFRKAATYAAWLRTMGARDVAVQRVKLDVDFLLVTAVARGDRPRTAGEATTRPPVIRFRHDEDERALELSIDAFVAGAPAFATTGRFSLSYRPWPGTNVTEQPHVAALLAAARAALARADQAGATLEQARRAVASAAAAGWKPAP